MRILWVLALTLPAAAAQAQDTVIVSGKRVALDGTGSTIVEDADAWQARGRPALADWLHALPGVQANRGEPGQSLPTLRGIGTVTVGAQLGTQQATTGLYLDDVPLTDPFGFTGTPDLGGFEIARLEVLRGPQGVLYGAASLGGAINVALQPAGTGGGMARVSLRLPVAGRPAAAIAAAVDRPLGSGGDGLRVEAFSEQGGGDIDNLGTGRADANRQRRGGARIDARWRLGNAAALRLGVLKQGSHADDTSAVWPDPQVRATRTPTASGQRQALGFARAELVAEPAPGLRFTAVTGWVDKQVEYRSDQSRIYGSLGSAVPPPLGPLPDLGPVVAESARPTRTRALSQELRLAGGAPGGVSWVTGAFVQRTVFDNDTRNLAPEAAARWGALAPVLLPGNEVGALVVQAHAREDAVFGEVDWPLADGLRASAGARAYRAALDYEAQVRVSGTPVSGHPATADRGVTPRLGLSLDLGRHSAYALLSRGYRVGGVNFDPPAFTRYRPDRLQNQELGLRLRPAPGATLDLTLFRMDWRDAQVSAQVTEPLPLVGVANVGRARSRGLETALHWPLPGAARVGLQAAFIDAATQRPFVTAAGQPVAAGAALPGTPRRQVGAQLEQPLVLPGGWSAEARLEWMARSRRIDAIGSEAAAPGRGQLAAGLSARQGPWQWQLRLDNIGNVTEAAGTMVTTRVGQAPLVERYLTPPRRWTLSLRHDL